MDLKGRRALITGSTSGIGLGIAEELARQGCDILLNGFATPAEIEALQTRLHQQFNVQVRHIAADVSNPNQCRAMALNALSFGAVDILVNNAGIQHVAPIDAFPPDRWDAILATNLSSAFHLTAALLPAMRNNGWGRIINIASVHGLVGSKDKSAYVAAKHGLVGLTKVTALETAGQGITCNAICPGWVLTPLVEAQLQTRMQSEAIDRPQAEHRLLREKQPSGQFSTPTQIGALAVFLCSAHAANITGASLPVDGAWTAQ
jgi:3-hydroxybutyrate dehydrogenase